MELQELATIVSMGGAIILLLFVGFFPPLAILSLILAMLSYLFNRWGHLYVPIFQGRRNIKTKYNVEMTPSKVEDNLQRKRNGLYSYCFH